MELQRAKSTNADNEDQIRRLRDTIADLETSLGKTTIELQSKDEAIRQIDVDVREMQAQIETQQRQNEVLRVENEGLRRDLDGMRNMENINQ